MSGEGTPGSIPNPAVKFVSADGTAGATLWESRSLPTRSLFPSLASYPPVSSPFLSCPYFYVFGHLLLVSFRGLLAWLSLRWDKRRPFP